MFLIDRHKRIAMDRFVRPSGNSHVPRGFFGTRTGAARLGAVLKPTPRIIRRTGALVLPLLLVVSVATAEDAPAPEAAAPTQAASSAPATAAVTTSGAQAVIGQFNGVLLSMMKQAEELGYLGRFDMVAPIVRETFDCSFMARKTVGKYWDKLSDEEQARWVETFENFTVSNLADRFHGYSGQSFEVLGERPASRNTLIVLTLLHRTGGAEDVELNYRMRENEAGWQVIDVYANGKVSEVALRRAEYARSLKQGGIELLIDSVAKMTANRAAPAS